MAGPSRERDRERLEQELESIEYQGLLRILQLDNPFLQQFPTWAEIIVFMRKGSSVDPRKDEVLRSILAAHAVGQDPRWRTILLVIFWPGLTSLHIQKRHWDKDPDELWHNIVWTFLQILCRIDVSRRTERLPQKIFNDTAHHLHDEYRRIWIRSEREKNTEIEVLVSVAARPEDSPYAIFLQREEQETEIRRLREHLEAGRITEIDFLLLVGTRVYGKPVVDCAREMGLAYQAAKKRRQRAEAAIRRFQEEIEDPG
ncbi:MAG: hypothetical protein OHK0028_07800 [Deltaproteobacteria bacterium]